MQYTEEQIKEVVLKEHLIGSSNLSQDDLRIWKHYVLNLSEEVKDKIREEALSYKF